jgi:ArsR family transcriptional regulator
MPKPLPIVEPVDSACCAPLVEAPLSHDEAGQLAKRFKALGDPARLRLLSLLMSYEDGEACTCDVTDEMGLTQPTVTHHLRRLAEAGLVSAERRGTWTYYRVEPEALSDLAVVLSGQPE